MIPNSTSSRFMMLLRCLSALAFFLFAGVAGAQGPVAITSPVTTDNAPPDSKGPKPPTVAIVSKTLVIKGTSKAPANIPIEIVVDGNKVGEIKSSSEWTFEWNTYEASNGLHRLGVRTGPDVFDIKIQVRNYPRAIIFGIWILAIMNVIAVLSVILIYFTPKPSVPLVKFSKSCRWFFVYESMLAGALVMLLPFVWMIVTSFKDAETALDFPPSWIPVRREYIYHNEETNTDVKVKALEVQRKKGDPIRLVPTDKLAFKEVDMGGFTVTREEADPSAVFKADPAILTSNLVTTLDPINFKKAWYAPEEATRGSVNFGGYFFVSLFTGIICCIGTLCTSSLAAFAFAKMEFWGKGAFFYIVLLTMMVPGQVLLIPNFMTLGKLGWLDTYAALIVPFLASVFTIFLMRQFFMTVPDELWDAAQIDGAGRFRFLWQVVAPLSKPVFITAGLFVFLGNWNALLWPLIVTSSPEMRTLMVGLQTFNQEAGSEFHLLMAASTMAVFPIVMLFFILQRFFIQGIARTGLK